MNRNEEYRSLYPELPKVVFEAHKFARYTEEEMRQKAKQWYEECELRRTTRHFSTEAVL